jgi:hypothetical protein
VIHKTTRRSLLKAGGALGLASLGWLGALVPELRTVRASQIPKARVDPLTGTQLERAVAGVLASPHVAVLSARLAARGFARTGQDEAIAIQSDTRGQDLLTYVWYAKANGEMARLTDLASNSNQAAVTFIRSSATGTYILDTHQVSVEGSLVHTERGVIGSGRAAVTYTATGVTKTYSLPPAITAGSTASLGVLEAEACWGRYCGGNCDWLRGHACSISCGLTGTFFCLICCGWNPIAGTVCGIAWVFICEYGWSCNSFTCCLVGLCCC